MTVTPDVEDLLDVHDVAKRLKVRVRYVYRLVAEQRIPFLKIGHHVRFRSSDIEAWLNDASVAAFVPSSRRRGR